MFFLEWLSAFKKCDCLHCGQCAKMTVYLNVLRLGDIPTWQKFRSDILNQNIPETKQGFVGAGTAGGRETHAVTKQRVIVSNWDGSQIHDIRKQPIVSSHFTLFKCDMSPFFHSHLWLAALTHRQAHVNTACQSRLGGLSLCLSRSQPAILKFTTLPRTHKQTATRTHHCAPGPRGRTVCLSWDRGEL